MRKWLLILAMGMILIFPSFAFAQNEVRIASLEVSLWPEYDRPQVLVINTISLSPDTSFPATVELRMPVAAKAPHVVAVGVSAELVTDQGVQFTTKRVGKWLVVSIEASGPAIQFEYYDPGLKKDGDLRSYVYEWSSSHDVVAFAIAVQKPFDAVNMKTSPVLADDGIYPNKLRYYRSELDPIPAGASFLLEMSYEKPTDTLSVSRLQVEPVEVNEDTPGRISLNNYLPYVMGGLGVILVIGGVIYYWQSGGTQPGRESRRKRPAAEDQEHPTGIYCAQCGARAKVGDRFCRVCGARLRHQE
jgi:hypothetical protein